MHTCKKWTEKDKRRLMIAYHMGAKYSWLCEMFDRSESAINKYLGRSGIRSTKKPQKTRSKRLFSFKDIWTKIKHIEQTDPLEEPKAKKAFKKPVYFQALNKQQDNEPTIYCENFQKPLKYLLSLGFKVKKIQSPIADYLVNSQALSSHQLIIMVNRYRLYKALKPFAVEGFID